jgi:hypothetical protein
MLIADLGHHDLIIGRKWMAAQGILDVRNRKMIWPDETPTLDPVQIAQELSVNKRALQRPAQCWLTKRMLTNVIKQWSRKINRNANLTPRKTA